MKKFNILFICFLCMITFWNICYGLGDTDLVQQEQKQFQYAIQINPVSLISKSIYLNYEYLIEQKFGFLIKGSYSLNQNAKGFQTGAGLRWHWSEKMESGFVGLYFKYSHIDGKMEIEKVLYPYLSTDYGLGITLGKRWVWDSGFNVVFRIGYGYYNFKYDFSNGEPQDWDTIVKFIKIIGKLDGELTIGYTY